MIFPHENQQIFPALFPAQIYAESYAEKNVGFNKQN